MKKISFKIGVLLFCLLFLMELCLFFLLHQTISRTVIDEQLSALLTKGNNHRDVLETYYNEETIHHIALMEAKSDTDVVITNDKNEIIISSTEIMDRLEHLFQFEKANIKKAGKVIEDNWKTEKYIATVSPFQIQNETGFVYMLQETRHVQKLISQLNRHFLTAAMATFMITAMIIFILSKIITNPLVKMKEATKKLSEGNFSIQLHTDSNDELGELAQAIQSLSNELNHLKTERNEFLASISHELRTPLTYMKGYAEIAKNTNISEVNRQEYLDIIIDETTKLTTLVTELIELAKLDNHTFTIKKEKVNLTSTLNTVVQKLQTNFAQEDKTLFVKMDNDIFIHADPIRLEQMIINLLENARKYSSKNSVTIIELKTMNGEMHLHITDNGKGIPKHDIPFIFDRFYRVDKSRSRELGGTGLGLSIVKEIADAHQWTIEVNSKIDEGTTFIIIIRED